MGDKSSGRGARPLPLRAAFVLTSRFDGEATTFPGSRRPSLAQAVGWASLLRNRARRPVSDGALHPKSDPPMTVALRRGRWGLGWFLLLLGGDAAQNGDDPNEPQPAVDRRFEVPAAPIRTPAQEQATFQVPPGYVVELVASEPLVHDPVDLVFDALGRLWVVEMRALMRNADGEGELDPVGSIAVLDDRDGDGEFEHRQVFADGLVLPRGIAHGFGGVIAVLPPRLVWMQDSDGDGRADRTEVIDEGAAFAPGLDNPEHAPNAPRIGLDNWLYLINHPWRYRRVAGAWERSRVPRRGQWGAGQDDWGRQVYDYNSTPLHGDRVPVHYLVRNPALGLARGSNARLVEDGQVYSRRINVGVNRAYREGVLREDGHLARYTAACGPVVFRGTGLKPEDGGSTFVCEPAGNLIRHNRMRDEGGWVSGEPVRGAYDFLTSTDERFRPVNLRNGPDGALYVVDLYRGILQHRVFLTSFLRRQIEERGLDQGIGLGRIWRIRHQDGSLGHGEPPGKLSVDRLLAALGSANGWRRSQAQQLLIEVGQENLRQPWQPNPLPHSESTPATVRAELLRAQAWQESSESGWQALQAMAISGSLFERLHAAWALEGLGGLNEALVLRAFESEQDARLLAQWVRLSEPYARGAVRAVWARLAQNADTDRRVLWQLAHSLGEVEDPAPQAYDGPALFADGLALAPDLLEGREADAILREGLLSGLAHRELELIGWLDPNAVRWDEQSPEFAYSQTVFDIGRLVARRGEFAEIVRLFERAAWPAAPESAGSVARTVGGRARPVALPAELPPVDSSFARPASEALLRGFVRGLEERPTEPFQEPAPEALAALIAHPAPAIAAQGQTIASRLRFEEPALDPAALAAYDAAMLRGQQVYRATCAACHQRDGRGLPDLAPPLGDPDWLGLPDEDLIRIVIEGKSGKIVVDGQEWNRVMPPWTHLNDRQVADVLTYVVGTFGRGPQERRTFEPQAVQALRR